MIFWRKPSIWLAEDYVRDADRADFSYEPSGITQDVLPVGFRQDRIRRPLGRGLEVFQKAKSALQGWAIHDQRWVRMHPEGLVPRAGLTIGLWTRIGFIWVEHGCRVVYLIDEESPRPKFAFAYGSLDGSFLCGESRFTIELTDEDRVIFEVLVYSRPGRWFSWVTLPFLRWYQRKFIRGTYRRLYRAVTRRTRGPSEHESSARSFPG